MIFIRIKSTQTKGTMVAVEAAPPTANGAAAGVAPAAEEQGGMGWFSLLRMVVLWYGINKVTSYLWTGSFNGAQPADQPNQSPQRQQPVAIHPGSSPQLDLGDDDVPESPVVSQLGSGLESFDPNFNPFRKFAAISPSGKRLPAHTNLFPLGVSLDLLVYVTESVEFDFDDASTAAAVWSEPGLTYDYVDADPERKTQLNVTVSDRVLNHNATLYAHAFFTRSNFDSTATVYRQVELITYRPRAKKTKRRNLLHAAAAEVDDSDDQQADDRVTTYVAHWKPSLIVNLVCDHTSYARGTAPLPFIAPHMQVDPISGQYLPILYLNDFWVLEDHLIRVNQSTTTLSLEVTYYPMSLIKFGLYQQMTQNFRNQQTMGTGTKKDADAIKKLFIETNPYLLAVTVVVSILHTVFDMLAFKNDVSFWRKQKSMEGLSVRTVVLNAFFHLVIFLYLLDNDTSWMILFSSGLGVVLDVWKIHKAVKVTRDASSGKWSVQGEASYDSSTAEHDRVAVAHVSYVMYPLLVGYAAYQLGFSEHKSWYSWVLSSLTSFVYAFGFIMMTPQLYINYKLQSVAHLPWRAMVYKSLNTFIDDLFAFVITMPMMHRLACFRDDVIFFVYLYQRWIYRVDKTRVNEFGQGGGDDGDQAPELLPAAAIANAHEESETVPAVATPSPTPEPPSGPRRRSKLDKST
ncbi:hypothetical protein DYB38_010306 [Aphanomyces astaci]|uniref:Cleft lip and palate transmembrane protein 1 n=2 Tax=Aphanomyces astaci TaxID=112090 RepID=A0A397CJK4_APHAT|nr:hypothetical protein DYB38_010306 [Aphanomyces astaci]